MKTNRFFKYCCIALVAVGFGLNIQNAIENYGIGENSTRTLWLLVVKVRL